MFMLTKIPSSGQILLPLSSVEKLNPSHHALQQASGGEKKQQQKTNIQDGGRNKRVLTKKFTYSKKLCVLPNIRMCSVCIFSLARC